MFKLLRVRDVVRIPPDRFEEPLDVVATSILREKYEGVVLKDIGIIVAVVDVKVSPTGKILPGDGATYHWADFTMLVFIPQIQEVIEGEVVEVTEFGLFVRMGPVDGLVHVSQIMDDYIVYDERRGALMGKETRKIVQTGDPVRARIVTVSLTGGGTRGSKIGLTMRQPFLGKLEWIEEALQKMKEEKVPAKKK